MVEPVTGVGIAAITAYLAKDGVQKLLGPTTEFLGSELQRHVERSYRNVGKVIEKSIKLLGKEIDKPGSVEPRLFKKILDEAAFAEDPVVQNYLSGILVSSREENPNDNAVPYLDLLSSLSAKQIYFHYFYYSEVRKHFYGKSDDFMNSQGRRNMAVFLPDSTLMNLFSVTDTEDSYEISEYCIQGLLKHSLLGDSYVFGSAEFLKSKFPKHTFSEYGMVVRPSMYGASLWLWAQGFRNTGVVEFLGPNVSDKYDSPIDPKIKTEPIITL